MGSMLRAQCSCGFQSGIIYAGGGMMNFNEVLNAPALCKKCRSFLVENYLKHDSRCPHCGEKILFYNDPGLFKGNLTKDRTNYLFHWRLPDNFDSIHPENNNFFCLPKTNYTCPQCGKMKMKFIDVGCWD